MPAAAARQIADQSDHVVFFEVGVGLLVVGMQVQRFLNGESRLPTHGGVDDLPVAAAPAPGRTTASARVPASARISAAIAATWVTATSAWKTNATAGKAEAAARTSRLRRCQDCPSGCRK